MKQNRDNCVTHFKTIIESWNKVLNGIELEDADIRHALTLGVFLSPWTPSIRKISLFRFIVPSAPHLRPHMAPVNGENLVCLRRKS